MALFVIGDLHLALGVENKAMDDLFKSWHQYVDRLEKNWAETVCEEDTVVIAGDVSWGMTLPDAAADFAFIHHLPGKKILLKGNHDYWFNTKKKCEDFFLEQRFTSLSILFNNAFSYGDYAICGTRGWINEQGEAVDKKVLNREAGRLRLSLEAGKALKKEPIAFLHYPPVYYIYECPEIMDVLQEYGVRRCYYGHIHGSAFRHAIDGVYKGIDYHLISADYLEFNLKKILD